MNNRQSKPSTRGLGILPLTEKAITLIGSVVIAFSGNYALAQITPDQTLGNESSVVTPNSTIRGEPGDLIEGGAARGSNLFHSFQDFNVGQLQRVYFANPAGIENILSRVTGSNISNILGTLGVDGGANLFLLNPNGIVFGQNARLDVAGSFFASTANSLVFNNGTEFSATNPEAPPLLSINITPGLQYGLNHPKPTKITNAGYLVVGQDLTLAAGQLDLQGQLIAGGNLTLHGEDTVQIRDSIGRPFIAAAGGKLLIQGNQGVDIFALNHPDSGLVSGGDLVLRSQNTVAGDAHYWSGGSFRIEQLDGSLGDLFSPDDPIIRSVGDVSFNSYLGTSLHIVAGGAVDIGFVIITGNETGTEGIDFISEAITLSNGTVVNINGQAEPTLDIRAGVDPTEVGIPGLTGNQFLGDLSGDFFNIFGTPTITNTATSADITIGTIAFADVNLFDLLSQNISANDLLAGTVLLTNQYKPNPSLAGDIEVSATLGSLVPNVAIQNGEVSKGGSVTIDSRGSITLNGIVNTIAIPSNDPSNPFSGNGGDVTFLANDNITLNPGSFIASAGIEGGKITLNSGSNFLLDDAGVVTLTAGTTGADKGGNLIVNAPESVTLINTEGSGFSNLGELLNEFTNSNLLERLLRVFNGSGLATVTTGPGNSGDLTINTRTLSIQNQAQNQESRSLAGAATVTLSGSSGNSGNLTVNAESVDILGNETDPFIPTPNERLALAIRAIPTGLTTATNSTGKAGDLTINTQRLTIQNGAGVTTATVRRRLENAQDGGNLTINATESVTLSGKVTLATATLNSGNAGELKVTTPTLTLEKGAVIAADTTGSGDAGKLTISTEQLLVRDGSRIGAATGNSGTGANITVIASDLVELVGTAVDDQNTVVPSGIFANSQFINDTRNELGDAGSINIDTEKLIVRDGAVVSSSTEDAGAGGTITIDVNTLEITTGGQLRTTAFGDGRAGDITLNIDKTVVIANPNSGLLAETEGAGAGGTITINTQDLTLQDQAQISASTFGTGTSGNIVVKNADSVELADNSSISTEVKAGAEVNPSPGEEVGNINLKTRSLTLTNESQITASTSGIGDAGSIFIQEAEQVDLNRNSSISTAVNSGAVGNGGDIDLETESLSLDNTSTIEASTAGTGDAGSITIPDAQEVNLDRNSSISTAVNTGAVAQKDSNIAIKTRSLTLNDSDITASTSGIGDAGSIFIQEAEQVDLNRNSSISTAVNTGAVGNGGNIDLKTRTLKLNQSQITASTDAQGDAGQVQVRDAQQVDLNLNSSISTAVNSGAVAEKASNIDIKTRSLTLNNESDITASTSGKGNAGSITIQEAQQVNLVRNSSISTAVNSGANGNGGNVDIETKSLSLDHTSTIEASTAGNGNAGSIKIPDAEEVSLNRNSSISTEIKEGAVVQKDNNIDIDSNIDIKTRTLTLNDSDITASTSGKGNAGSITIQEAQQVNLVRNSSISTAVNSGADGNGGNIDLKTRTLKLNQSQITASTDAQGDAGSIFIQEAQQVNLNRNSSISTAVNSGADAEKAGNIDLKTRTLTLTNDSQITASTSGKGDAGQIKIQEAQQVDLNRNSSISTAVNTGAEGNGGNVDIETKSLSLDHTSTIEASTAGNGNAGSITIPDAEEVSLNRNSSISTAVNSGADAEKAGSIDLKTRTLTLTNDSDITASTSGEGDAGSIVIQEAQQVNLNRNSSISTAVNTGAEGNGGNVDIETKSLSLDNDSEITASTSGEGDAGSITIPDAEEVNLNRNSSISTAVNSGAVAEKGGSIDLKTRTLTLTKDSQITASTSGEGDAGSIFIQEAQQVNLNRNSSISTAVNTGAVGNGGNVDIETKSLSLDHTSKIEASTAGTGDAGSITIPDAEEVSLNRNSSISTAVNPGAVGNGGNIDIKTRSLTLTNNSEITSSTAGDGDAGNITLRAEQVTIEGDSQVSATTSRVTDTDRGKGGNIEIIEANRFRATDGGNVRTTTEGNKQAGNITLEVRDDITLAGAGSGLFANTTRDSSGDGGNIFVDPRTVTIRDGAKIAVDSQGQGKGGNIELQAGTLTLDNQAELSAETASNQGGNITLTIDELLFLRRNSKISTTAGTAQAGGDGGNITINAPFIIGIRQEDSDITANAFEGNGGNINITTQGIIGLEFRENLTPLSDITASSEFGVDGTVNINAPQIDPSRGLSELPTDVIDVSQLIEKNLCAAGEGSEFIATGRGGLPISPNETLNPNATWDDWRITEQPQTRIRKRRSRSRQHQLQINQPQTNKPKPKQIVEAQGWVIGANGEVILTAHPVIVTPKGTWLHQVDCPMLHQTFK
ncbi:MAG: filamentous hemagglutinin N-terminal domain-containing protein [Moorea sp. SIOASIH]|uniref:two-partner secretion domain-containing protein n=1 Tax=Moorena sp. SIOASIH TaxID=2607817 RepID=UPI0013B75BFE|nr:filamentous hemagglutinin N-terminal domain-containing protein [Moorena sp. SIOASIH]NEO42029.1 filamentous hemagglutinin N-terminal domain-containing protein [Moorena sp. SIOASIH]